MRVQDQQFALEAGVFCRRGTESARILEQGPEIQPIISDAAVNIG